MASIIPPEKLQVHQALEKLNSAIIDTEDGLTLHRRASFSLKESQITVHFKREGFLGIIDNIVTAILSFFIIDPDPIFTLTLWLGRLCHHPDFLAQAYTASPENIREVAKVKAVVQGIQRTENSQIDQNLKKILTHLTGLEEFSDRLNIFLGTQHPLALKINGRQGFNALPPSIQIALAQRVYLLTQECPAKGALFSFALIDGLENLDFSNPQSASMIFPDDHMKASLITINQRFDKMSLAENFAKACPESKLAKALSNLSKEQLICIGTAIQDLSKTSLTDGKKQYFISRILSSILLNDLSSTLVTPTLVARLEKDFVRDCYLIQLLTRLNATKLLAHIHEVRESSSPVIQNNLNILHNRLVQLNDIEYSISDYDTKEFFKQNILPLLVSCGIKDLSEALINNNHLSPSHPDHSHSLLTLLNKKTPLAFERAKLTLETETEEANLTDLAKHLKEIKASAKSPQLGRAPFPADYFILVLRNFMIAEAILQDEKAAQARKAIQAEQKEEERLQITFEETQKVLLNNATVKEQIQLTIASYPEFSGLAEVIKPILETHLARTYFLQHGLSITQNTLEKPSIARLFHHFAVNIVSQALYEQALSSPAIIIPFRDKLTLYVQSNSAITSEAENTKLLHDVVIENLLRTYPFISTLPSFSENEERCKSRLPQILEAPQPVKPTVIQTVKKSTKVAVKNVGEALTTGIDILRGVFKKAPVKEPLAAVSAEESPATAVEPTALNFNEETLEELEGLKTEVRRRVRRGITATTTFEEVTTKIQEEMRKEYRSAISSLTSTTEEDLEDYLASHEITQIETSLIYNRIV